MSAPSEREPYDLPGWFTTNKYQCLLCKSAMTYEEHLRHMCGPRVEAIEFRLRGEIADLRQRVARLEQVNAR